MAELFNLRPYLMAMVPTAVAGHLRASRDFAPARSARSWVEDHRRHITILKLGVASVSLEGVVDLARAVMSTCTPDAFHVAFDQLIVIEERAMLKASLPLAGVERCQAGLRDALRTRHLDLPRLAAPRPHVTLGYHCRDPVGVLPIDPVSWRVDELALVVSVYGQHRHAHLGRWRLPDRRKEAT